jgi:hypothetical protein
MGKNIIPKINLIHIEATSKKSLRKDYYRLSDIKRLLLFELHRAYGFLVQQETYFSGFEFHRSRVHFIMCGSP